MKGPYEISLVDNYVTRISAGAYILSRDRKVAHYVGRSDTNLALRIKDSANEGFNYEFFWFEYTTSPMQAYYLECEWWHRYAPPDNEKHPAVPPGTFWKCPISGCPWS